MLFVRLLCVLFATIFVLCEVGCQPGEIQDGAFMSDDDSAGGGSGGVPVRGENEAAAGFNSGGAGGSKTIAQQSDDGRTPRPEPDGGIHTPDATASTQDDPPAGWVPALVGVGGAGVRFRSINGGVSWPFEARLAASGGDDQNLLRAVAYGKEIWVTGGWQYFTSVDAKTWTKRTHPCGGGVVDGMAFGAGRFIAACGEATYWSADGVAWTRGGKLPSGGHPKVVFGEGIFAGSGDAGQAYSSKDGVNWAPLPGVKAVAVCNGAIKDRAQCFNAIQLQGAYFKGYTPELGGSGVHRSVDGKTWTTVHPIGVDAFASGFVPAQ